MERIIVEVTSGEEAKRLLKKGVDTCATIIGDTMGYRGNNNLFETVNSLPSITSDGWDSLEQLFFENPVESLAAEVVKEAAQKTRDEVGDQTTTTTVLTQAFFENSLKAVESGKSSIEIKQETEESVAKISEYLKSISIPVTDKLIYDIAKTSAHGDEEIADVVQKAYIQAGEFGVVSHKRSFTNETFIEHINGVLLDAGFADERFINVPESQSVVFDNNPLILCSETFFETSKEIIPFWEYAAKLGRDLVFVSGMAHGVKNSFVANFLEGHRFVVVNLPYSGKQRTDALNDIGLTCGMSVINGLAGNMFEGKEHLYLGSAAKVEINAKRTIITPCESISQEPAQGKIQELTTSLKTTTGYHEKLQIKNRISKLAGKISTIKVGGLTTSEVEEKLARMDDAICAVRSAKEEGVVSGGGMALYSAYSELELDEVTKTSLLAPFNKIILNANASLKIYDKLFIYPMGYDVKEYKEVNMIEVGIVDSVKGIRCALANAVSASNNLLRTNNVITKKRLSNG